MRKQVILGADVAASCETSCFIIIGRMRLVKADPEGRFRVSTRNTITRSHDRLQRFWQVPLPDNDREYLRSMGERYDPSSSEVLQQFQRLSMQRRQKEDLRANKLKPSRKLSAKRRSTRFASLRSISWSRAFPRRQDKSLSCGLLKFGDKDARLIDLGKQCLGKTGRRWRYKQGARARRHCARGRCKHRHWDSLRVLNTLLGSLLVGIFFMRSMCSSHWFAVDSVPAAVAKFEESSNFCTRSGPKSGVRIRTATSWRFFRMIQLLLLLLCLRQADGVKVEMDSTAISGASAKPRGGTALMPTPDNQAGSHARQVIKKRAYRRALNRALQHGTTRYRGRVMTAAQASWYNQPRLVPQRSESGISRKLRDRDEFEFSATTLVGFALPPMIIFHVGWNLAAMTLFYCEVLFTMGHPAMAHCHFG